MSSMQRNRRQRRRLFADYAPAAGLVTATEPKPVPAPSARRLLGRGSGPGRQARAQRLPRLPLARRRRSAEAPANLVLAPAPARRPKPLEHTPGKPADSRRRVMAPQGGASRGQDCAAASIVCSAWHSIREWQPACADECRAHSRASGAAAPAAGPPSRHLQTARRARGTGYAGSAVEGRRSVRA